jgi:hypothetical protein
LANRLLGLLYYIGINRLLALRIYPASKTKHLEFWKALRAAGLPIVASWIDSEINLSDSEPTSDAWQRHWATCVNEAAAADITLLYAAKDERQMGSLIEAGAALAAGKQIFLVSPHPWSWRHHERVRSFDSLAKAVEVLMAATNGERMRPQLVAASQ